MRHIIDLCAETDDLAVIVADRDLDGYKLVWPSRIADAKPTDRVVVNDTADALSGQVGKRIVLVFAKT